MDHGGQQEPQRTVEGHADFCQRRIGIVVVVKLHELGAHQLIAAYHRRELSPVEVTQAVLAHMERWEPHIHATICCDRSLRWTRRALPRPAGSAVSRVVRWTACLSPSRKTSPRVATPCHWVRWPPS